MKSSFRRQIGPVTAALAVFAAASARANECGVMAVAAAIESLGGNIDLNRYWSSRYIDSAEGSSVEALEEMVAYEGFQATATRGLSVSCLSRLGSPAVLLVYRTDGSPAADPDHWVAYLGSVGDRHRVFDPYRGLLEVGTPLLQAIWPGTAVVIGDDDSNVWRITTAFAASEPVSIAMLVGLALASVRGLLPGRRDRVAIRHVAIITIPVVATVLIHIPPADRFEARAAVAEVKSRYLRSYREELTDTEFAAAVADPEVTLVDARLKRDFESGHINGAISFPVNASIADRVIQLKRVRSAAAGHGRIVVYCQSERCRFDDHIAAWLSAAGLKNVRSSSIGWSEWKAR